MVDPRSPFGPSIIAGLIVGAAILAGSLVIKSSLDGIRTGLTETKDALGEVAKARPAKDAPSRSRKPDPNKRYTVKTAGAPVKGNPGARVKVVEFSDFQ